MICKETTPTGGLLLGVDAFLLAGLVMMTGIAGSRDGISHASVGFYETGSLSSARGYSTLYPVMLCVGPP